MINPVVSIIIPVYNGSNYMREAIDSALAQTYPYVEVLVVNDGSNDNGETRDIALSYGEQIRYFEKENGGVSTALNFAIQKMNGEYFSWLSHDDIYHHEKIAMEIDVLNSFGDMTIPVYSGWASLIMPERKYVIWEEHEKRYNKKYFESGLFAVTMGLINGCSLLIHKTYFEKYGLFDVNLKTTQDYTKWFEMFKNKKMLYIDKPLVQTRLHREQTGVTYNNFKYECDELHLWMVENIRASYQEFMGWNLYHFFSILLPRLDVAGFKKSYQYVYKSLSELEEPEYTTLAINELMLFLNHYKQKLYLSCAGKRGKALLNYFKLHGISVEGFIDSNKALWGLKVSGVECFPKDKIDKENAIVIITKAEPQLLKDELLKDGFKQVITYNEIEERLCEVPVKKSCL